MEINPKGIALEEAVFVKAKIFDIICSRLMSRRRIAPILRQFDRSVEIADTQA
jgi:hypothetical protein